jgi:tetratricopeptide (TPR) repeat protein
MPTTTYMIVDPRHDHSIRIPRPDLTRILGTPNACNQCHTDKTATWAADAVRSWYPSPKPGFQSYAQALHSGDSGGPGAQILLKRVAKDTSQPAIARASAVARLGRFLTPKSISIVIDALKDPDPAVRMAAIAALANADPRVRLALLPPLLADDARIVRMDAARALAGQIEEQLKPEDRKRFNTAIDEYIAAQRFNADRPESLVNLANLYIARRQRDDAESALLKALELDKTFAPAYVALAENRRAQGDEAGAEAVLRDGSCTRLACRLSAKSELMKRLRNSPKLRMQHQTFRDLPMSRA